MSSRIHTFWSILFLLVILNSAVYAATVQLPATGQIKCYDPGSYSELPTCAGTGQDGELQSGLAWNAATRFTNNNNGTITDNLTGLIWLHDGNCTATLGGVAKTAGLSWGNAITWSNNLASGSCGLTDGSIAGQWRMPNIYELKSLIASGQPGYFSWLNSHGFTNTDKSYYWASNSSEYAANNGSVIEAQSGSVRWDDKSNTNIALFYVLPVRSGTPAPDAPVIRTGATTSYAIGDDGSVQAGVLWPNPRFSDNGNGTMLDNLTGLVWLKNTLCTDTASVEKTSGTLTWADALTWSNNLANGKCGLTDGSTPGDWRLPNSNEIYSLANFKYYNLIDWLTPQGFTNVIQSEYWTSSTLEHYNDPSAAHAFSSWMMYLYPRSKSYEHFPVLPVRNEAFRFDSLLVYAALRFGTLSVNTTSPPKEVLIRNTHTVNAKQLTISLTGLNPTEFSVVAGGTNSCGSLTPTLAAGASCTIQVTAHPTTAGAKTAYLRVATAAGHKDIPVTTDTTHDGVCGSANGQTFVDAPTSGLCTVGAPSTIPSGAGPWSWTCDSTNGGTGSETCSATQLQTYTVTATAGTGGSISCVPTTVVHGSSSVCTVTVNSGYSLNIPMGGSCGGVLSGHVSPYTFTTSAITGNCSVAANFTYTPNGSCGSANNQTFAAAPPSYSLCATGSPSIIPTGAGPWYWVCNGVNGGTSSPTCTATQNVFDAGNGTIVDTVNNRTWLQKADCFGTPNWDGAIGAVNGLASGACGLTDGSVVGNWRVPSIADIKTLTDNGLSSSSPGLFTGLGGGYWLSDAEPSDLGWYLKAYINMANGAIEYAPHDDWYFKVMAVRSGQFWSLGTLNFPFSLQFGVISVGTASLAKEVLIQNGTNASGPVSFSVAMTGANATDFSVVVGGSNSCSSLTPTLAAGAHCTVLVTGIPATVGDKHASLQITSQTGSKEIAITGTAVLPETVDCGSANNQFFTFPPTTNLCANGTPSATPSGIGPWSWTCNTSVCKAAQSYVDAGNGTVVDIINNLTWLQNPGCFPRQDWNTAMASSTSLASGSCGLSDYSSAGDYHLLSLGEMNSLMNSQAPRLGLFHNAIRDDWYYWTSTSYSSTLAYIGWFFSYEFGSGGGAEKTDTDYVWPVRSGQFWSYDSLAITAALQFGTQLVGVPSTPKTVIIKNSGATAKSSSVSLAGANAADFSVASGGTTPCGTLSPTLAAGTSCTLQVTANTTAAGLKLAGLRFTTTTGSRDLPVSAVSQQYSVTPTAGTGGGISCTPTMVTGGGISTCTITVDSSHVLDTPVGGSCGGTLSGSASPYSYSTNPVTANCTVNATFSAPVLAGTCGSANTQAFLSAPTSGLCATGTASVTPSGTGPWSWVCNGMNGGAASGTCSANQLYTVTPTSNGGGSITCNAATVIKGNTTTCSITANSGFALTLPVGGSCGGTLSGSTSPYSYTTSAITANCTVSTTFGRIITGVCGSSNNQSFFSAPTTGFCTTGTPSVIPTGTGPSWSWTCNGSSGGANSSTCTATQILSNAGNGTITDTNNGLIWLRNANCFTSKTWNNAISAANTLASGACGLSDGSSVGDWRLPTIDEQRLASDSGLRYYTMNGAGFTGVQPDYYWSSTAYSGDSNTAWRVNMVNGFVSFGNKSDALRVWPVRSGPLTFDSLTISGSLNFGVLSIGSTSPPHIITIHNSSSTISKSFSAAITGANASEFSVAPGGGSSCGSLNPTLAPNTSCTVQVTASPVITGTKSASLTITTSGGSRNMSITASTPENGSCGSANNQAFPSAPSANLCTKGVPSPVPSGVGPWSWVCNGTNGGTNSGSCKAIPTLVDAGNGTIVDTANSMTWLKKADCYAAQPYDNAATTVSTLANGTCGLTDGSTTGTWRQPTIKELQKLPDSGMRYTNFNAAGFTGVQPFKYWSSTMQDLVGCVRYYVNMLDGNVSYDNKLYSFNVWPVRPGQIWTHDSLIVNASLQFGSLSVGTTSPPKEVLIRNSASSSKAFSVAITGSNATEFSVTAGGSSSCGTLTPTLAAGASCTVQVTATPASIGIKSGHLTLTTSAGAYSIPATVSGSNGSQSITFSNPGTVTVGATKPLTATASSGLTVAFSSLTPAFCSVNASTVTGVASGSCTIAADQAGNNNFAPADRVIQSFTVAVPATLTVTISGNGSVTSQNQSGTNYTCNSGTCAPVTFATGDTVTLTATGSNSSFNAWSGNYTGTNNPGSITMTGNKAVTASFTSGTATVKIDGDSTAYYSINSALAVPTQDATIQARDTSFAENVAMENSHTLTLKGGYSDSNFTSQTGYSTISGTLTIKAGKLIVDRIKIGP